MRLPCELGTPLQPRLFFWTVSRIGLPMAVLGIPLPDGRRGSKMVTNVHAQSGYVLHVAQRSSMTGDRGEDQANVI